MTNDEKRKRSVDTIVSIIKTWGETDDICSPSHIDCINEVIETELSDVIGDASRYELKDKLFDLYIRVKRIDYGKKECR